MISPQLHIIYTPVTDQLQIRFMHGCMRVYKVYSRYICKDTGQHSVITW